MLTRALFIALSSAVLASAQLVPAASLASQFSLATSTSLPFPSATLSSSDAQTYLIDKWSLSKGKIQDLPENLQFVQDPFPNKPAPSSSTASGNSSVLQVTYPSGGFGTGSSGSQFYTLWNTSDGSVFNTMILTYEVAFDSGFDFVKGGKLPGLRGGPEPNGCSGGNAANGSNCFSNRLMWRTQGRGEVYAYLPDSKDLCSTGDALCNQDGFGTSIRRGAFSFIAGQWNRVTMLVRLNDIRTANGQVSLYYNDVAAINEQTVVFRTNSDINVGGMYFSTFYGGSDASWAPSTTTHTYFRNIQLYGSSAQSNLTGSKISAGFPTAPVVPWERLLAVVLGCVATLFAVL